MLLINQLNDEITMAQNYKASFDIDQEKEAIEKIKKLKVGQSAEMNKIKISLLDKSNLSLTQIDQP